MIPHWTNAAVLPPIWPRTPNSSGTSSSERSPYKTSLLEVVGKFAFSPQRRTILRGLLDYRAALASYGILEGFQWLNGSFMEHKEVLESASPNDIDVVTFFILPSGEDEESLDQKAPGLFDPGVTKSTYHVDSYYHILGNPLEREDVKQISYWYSMWSHRRNTLWKGFLEVDLKSTEDVAANELLLQLEEEEANS